MNDNIKIIWSNRKTIAVEIKSDCRVIVRAPQKMSMIEIQRFVKQKENWINKHLQLAQEHQASRAAVFTDTEIRSLIADARKDIPRRVTKYAPLVGVSYGKITIRNQKTRWGSCSEKGNLNFNCLLMMCPEEVRNYVVVHELCHRKVMSHSSEFWNEVRRVMPEYDIWRRWLKEHGIEMIGRVAR